MHVGCTIMTPINLYDTTHISIENKTSSACVNKKSMMNNMLTVVDFMKIMQCVSAIVEHKYNFSKPLFRDLRVIRVYCQYIMFYFAFYFVWLMPVNYK